MKILAEILGVIGIIFAVLTFQCRKYKLLVSFRTAHEFSFTLQYLVLDAYTGVAMNLIGVIRNIVFSIAVSKNKSTVPWQIIFSVITVVIGAITFNGWFSLLIIFAKVLSTVAYGIKKVPVLKCLILISTVCWIIYNLSIGSITGLINDCLTILSIIVSFATMFIIYRKNQKTTKTED